LASWDCPKPGLSVCMGPRGQRSGSLCQPCSPAAFSTRDEGPDWAGRKSPGLVRKKRMPETPDQGDHCSPPGISTSFELREASKPDRWVCFQTPDSNLPQDDGKGKKISQSCSYSRSHSSHHCPTPPTLPLQGLCGTQLCRHHPRASRLYADDL